MEEEYRENEVLKTDRELVRLVKRRMDLAGEQAVTERERDLLTEEMQRMAAGPEREAVQEVLDQTLALAGRRELAGEEEPGTDHGFTAVDELNRQGVKVVYQGVPGAYSHQASRAFFGEDASVCPVPTFEAAVAEIDAGAADYAVLPIENTTGGVVGDVLDLQMKYPCHTVAELDLPIHHVLLGIPGADLSQIDAVYSHAQGLAQCSSFLEHHRDWGQIPTGNTAASAKLLAEEGNPHHAAIASAMAGEIYGLAVLQEDIANSRTNTTRFIVVTQRKIYRRGARKIRICFECRHTTGALYRILGNFTFNSLNMTKIESRPIPGRRFEYRFFVDFEGNLEEAGVKNALNGIRAETSLCRILGNF